MIISCWRPYPRPRNANCRPAGMERGSCSTFRQSTRPGYIDQPQWTFAPICGPLVSIWDMAIATHAPEQQARTFFARFERPGSLDEGDRSRLQPALSMVGVAKGTKVASQFPRSSFPRPRESLSRQLLDRRPGRCFALDTAPFAYPACATRRAGDLPASPVHRPSKVGDLLIYPDRCPAVRLLSRALPAGATQARRCVVLQAHNRARGDATRLSPRCRVRVASLSHTGRKAGASGPKSATTL